MSRMAVGVFHTALRIVSRQLHSVFREIARSEAVEL